MRLIVILSMVMLLLNGCRLIDDLKNIQFVKPSDLEIEVYNLTNQTNSTEINATPMIKKSIMINESVSNIFIASATSILIIENNKSYVIDVPKNEPKIITYIDTFGIKELEFAVATINKEEHNGGIQYIVVKSPPKQIYDNGMTDEFRTNYIYRLDRFNSYWNRSSTQYTPLLYDSNHDGFKFYAPYSKGLSVIKEENSIVVDYKGQFLYMSDCYGECEKKIPPVTTTFFVLANNGNCPTNSFDFVLSTGAKYVMGDSVCSELKEGLDFIGIKSIITDKIIQILLEDDKYEIRLG